MFFDPAIFKAIWIGTACLALTVGLAVAALAVATVLAMVQVIRTTEPKQRAAVLAGYFRQGRHNQRQDHSASQEPANQALACEPPPNFPS